MNIRLRNLDEVRRRHDRFLADNTNELQGALLDAGRFGERYVHTFPRFKPRTGKTQDATGYQVVRTSGGRVLKFFNKARHAAALESGTRPHIIRSRSGGYLRFRGRDGNWVFRRSVRHPGTKPYRFMSSAYTAANARFKGDMTRRMTTLASRF